eukprot:697951-Prorocentrum_minimum.AAC.3
MFILSRVICFQSSRQADLVAHAANLRISLRGARPPSGGGGRVLRRLRWGGVRLRETQLRQYIPIVRTNRRRGGVRTGGGVGVDRIGRLADSWAGGLIGLVDWRTAGQVD